VRDDRRRLGRRRDERLEEFLLVDDLDARRLRDVRRRGRRVADLRRGVRRVARACRRGHGHDPLRRLGVRVVLRLGNGHRLGDHLRFGQNKRWRRRKMGRRKILRNRERVGQRSMFERTVGEGPRTSRPRRGHKHEERDGPHHVYPTRRRELRCYLWLNRALGGGLVCGRGRGGTRRWKRRVPPSPDEGGELMRGGQNGHLYMDAIEKCPIFVFIWVPLRLRARSGEEQAAVVPWDNASPDSRKCTLLRLHRLEPELRC
jgi:hypothetical protein